MKNKFMFTLPALALGLAGMAFAGSYFTIGSPVSLGTLKLKAGEYQVSVKKDQALITNSDGKTFKVPVKVEQAAKKFDSTSANTKDNNGMQELSEIDLGGSTTRLVFGQ